MELIIEQTLRLGPKTARELALGLGVSQPTLSRTIAKLEKHRRVIRIGNARATQYAASRPLGQLPENLLPVYEIDSKGAANRVATLAPVYPNHFAIVPEKNSAGYFPIKASIHPSLPYYLQSLRPDGFVGRLIAASVTHVLRTPGDIRLWNEDHVLAYAVNFGADLPGAFVVGETAIADFLSYAPAVLTGSREEILTHEAEKIESGEQVGSSAGGEQPKFTAYIQHAKNAPPVHTIVKFSSAAKNATAERWRDLLISEHMALETIAESGLPASRTRLVAVGNRIFLLVERFDRVGKKGRCHYFSFGALEDALHGERREIRKSARFFFENRLIGESDLEALTIISLFGDIIGNTDQHFGNISFTWENEKFSLAPAYDVLPMWYAPKSQGLIPQNLHPIKPILPEFKAYGKEIMRMATRYWSAVKKHTEISSGFRAIAARNLDRLGHI